ncbi:hypothetical protein [Salipaludibacillus sp. CF4.18]|uniref:hypothetical protein n=1 Tax=Salipaludibacillus sp. CF4.18 TaxID=3373081 RepID=UPI003EE5BBBA
MDSELHKKFSHVEFNEDQNDMFLEIVRSTPHLSRILMYILKNQSNQQSEGKLIGTTSANIANNLEVKRRVQVQNGKTKSFEEGRANITRKTAEKLLDILSSMSLLYYEESKPYKYHFLTERGEKLVNEIKKDFYNEKKRRDK